MGMGATFTIAPLSWVPRTSLLHCEVVISGTLESASEHFARVVNHGRSIKVAIVDDWFAIKFPETSQLN